MLKFVYVGMYAGPVSQLCACRDTTNMCMDCLLFYYISFDFDFTVQMHVEAMRIMIDTTEK